MTDGELVAFLQWALQRMGLRWRGFKDFRGTVKKRILRRLAELGLADLTAYRVRLEADSAEWGVLDGLCRITISRFYRDRFVMDALRIDVLPRAAALGRRVRVWSAGSASGEEPYTLALMWLFEVGRAHPGVDLELIATDADPALIDRARRGRYSSASLRELPLPLREQGFCQEGDLYVVRDEVRRVVDFRVEDLRSAMPDGPFDVVLCRNLAFTYFDEPLQQAVARRLIERIRPGGVLIIGNHESLPDGCVGLAPRQSCIHAREAPAPPAPWTV